MTFVTGGLDVLETIGKTTYDVLAEGDTGLKAILMKARDKPDLSKVSICFVVVVIFMKSVLIMTNETGLLVVKVTQIIIYFTCPLLFLSLKVLMKCRHFKMAKIPQ